MEQAGYVAIGLFAVGVIFQLGRFSARIEHLELWRTEVLARFDKIDQSLAQLALLIRGEER